MRRLVGCDATEPRMISISDRKKGREGGEGTYGRTDFVRSADHATAPRHALLLKGAFENAIISYAPLSVCVLLRFLGCMLARQGVLGNFGGADGKKGGKT